jgi:hypothetical protein
MKCRLVRQIVTEFSEETPVSNFGVLESCTMKMEAAYSSKRLPFGMWKTTFHLNIGNYLPDYTKSIPYVSLPIILRQFQCRTMLGGSRVTTAWRVLRLRMEGTASRYGG